MPEVRRCSCVAVHAIRFCSTISVVCACISIMRLKGPSDILIVQTESRSFRILTPLQPGNRHPTSRRSVMKDQTLLMGSLMVKITSFDGMYSPFLIQMDDGRPITFSAGTMVAVIQSDDGRPFASLTRTTDEKTFLPSSLVFVSSSVPHPSLFHPSRCFQEPRSGKLIIIQRLSVVGLRLDVSHLSIRDLKRWADAGLVSSFGKLEIFFRLLPGGLHHGNPG